MLEVGCGTGRLAAALAERESARVWGLDASPEMLEVARARAPRGVRFKVGAAESLPFKDGWFERAVLRLVVHLVDRPRTLAELARVLVPRGGVAIATFEPSHFDAFWLNRLFPSLEDIDRARFPDPATLTAELEAAGFSPRLVSVRQTASLDREAALERIRGRYISTLHLLDEDEFRAGLDRAERELPERIDSTLDWLIALGTLDAVRAAR